MYSMKQNRFFHTSNSVANEDRGRDCNVTAPKEQAIFDGESLRQKDLYWTQLWRVP